MEVKLIKSISMDQNCYLIKNGNTGILIDPGEDTFEILKETENTDVKYILLTHCHYDHIFSLKEIKGSKIVLGGDKIRRNITDPKITFLPSCENLEGILDGYFADREVKNLCGIEIKCIYTEGHTDCSVCYLAENCVFTGDTLFYGSIGRWDFPTGDYEKLENSVKNILYKLPNDTVVYPGHGESTTIGREKKYGYFRG